MGHPSVGSDVREIQRSINLKCTCYRYGFQRPLGDATNVYILNLAFMDLVYCVICAVFYFIPFFARCRVLIRHVVVVYNAVSDIFSLSGWPFGRRLCAVSAMIRYAAASGDWIALALIALSR